MTSPTPALLARVWKVLEEPVKQDACGIENAGMRAEVECQGQRLGGCLACQLVKDGADILKSKVDALFDALGGVASEEEDAARAHLDEQR